MDKLKLIFCFSMTSISSKQFFQTADYSAELKSFSSSKEEFCSNQLSKETFHASSCTIDKVTRAFHIASAAICSVSLASYLLPSLSNYTFAALTTSALYSAIASPLLSAATPYVLGAACLITARKVLGAIVGHLICPATLITLAYSLAATTRKVLSVIIKRFNSPETLSTIHDSLPPSIGEQREMHFDLLKHHGFVVKRMTVKKLGVKYDAFLIGLESTIHNGNWCLNPQGNAVVTDEILDSLAFGNAQLGLNTLIVNPPGVGNSKGWPTTKHMGDAQEAGMQLLEHTVKAKNVVLNGWSLGAGALSRAVLEHNFQKARANGTRYMMISDRSFDRLAHAAGCMIFRLATPILRLLSQEMDSVQAAKKLEKHNIKHLVIQKGFHYPSGTMSSMGDGVITKESSLAQGLQEAGMTEDSRLQFILDSSIYHCAPLPQGVQSKVKEEIQNFISQTSS